MGKQRWEESEKRKKSRERKSQNKEDADARKVRKVAKRYVFQCFMAAEGRKVGSLKLRVWSHLGKCETKNCTHAVVARNLLGSERAKKNMFGPLLEVEMLKSARCCGAGRASK
jgi:hypothetical protein